MFRASTPKYVPVDFPASIAPKKGFAFGGSIPAAVTCIELRSSAAVSLNSTGFAGSASALFFRVKHNVRFHRRVSGNFVHFLRVILGALHSLRFQQELDPTNSSFDWSSSWTLLPGWRQCFVLYRVSTSPCRPAICCHKVCTIFWWFQYVHPLSCGDRDMLELLILTIFYAGYTLPWLAYFVDMAIVAGLLVLFVESLQEKTVVEEAVKDLVGGDPTEPLDSIVRYCS